MSSVERDESDLGAAGSEREASSMGQERGTEAEATGPGGIRPVAGERGVPSVNRGRSLQSRMSSMLAMGLMMALGLGLLTWYYARAFTRPARALQSAQALARQRAEGDMPLPPLGPLPQPGARVGAPSAVPPVQKAGASELAALLGPAPPWPGNAPSAASSPAGAVGPPAQRPLDRRLQGPAFASASSGDSSSGSPTGSPSDSAAVLPPGMTNGVWPPSRLGVPETGGGQGQAAPPQDAGGAMLTGLLRPMVTPAVEARLLPTRRFLLPKGAFIDCTLETAIDSTLPGMTTCITATDTFSADGTVVLLERGTKLVGETRGEVQQGQARLFVLWTEARTPSGVVVPLDSPGTDALGRSGLSGRVERHFWERFGAAILVSVIDGAVQAGIQSTSRNGAVIVNPSTTEDVMTEVLKSTVDIPPTITVDQGTRIEILVARDVDFRSVYRLQPVSAVSAPGGTP
jgi:type IV secretion system protein VirB10